MNKDIELCLKILDDAIQFEEEGYRFFLDREQNAPSDLERRIFASLARDEAGHKAYLMGMKQKLLISCALLHRPEVLVFDEPLTGLDPASMRRTKRTIVETSREGTSVIVSSHMLHLV